MKATRAFLIFALFFSFYQAQSQQISNVQAQLQGDNIVISYDLISDNPNAEFDIKIYCSYNNFSSPLRLVRGDVGAGVKPGSGKLITWQAREEMVNYTGNISFEVRGLQTGGQAQPQETTNPNQLVLTNPSDGDKFKYGSIMSIRWKGGVQEDVKLELYQNNVMQRPIGTTPNTGTFNWNVPKDKSLKGSGYSLKIFNVNSPGSGVVSGTFRIKGKTSVVVYLIPVAVIGGVAGVLLSKKKTVEPPGGGTTQPTDLPAPPSLPSGG